jgi:hypothetical protein
MYYLFVVLLSFQTLICAVQDLVDIYPLNNLKKQYGNTPKKTWVIATFGNTLPPFLGLIFLLIFAREQTPIWVGIYLIAYHAINTILLYFSWYKLYFFGASKEDTDRIEKEYGDTLQILPKIKNNPRPNLLHFILHILFVLNTILSVMVGLNLIS